MLFTSDRGITPTAAARAAEERGFDTFYVPEHTHIPVRREAPHPGTGDESLPDDRYGNPLRGELSGIWAARRGTYRVLYRLNEDRHETIVVRIEHRRDAYRSR